MDTSSFSVVVWPDGAVTVLNTALDLVLAEAAKDYQNAIQYGGRRKSKPGDAVKVREAWSMPEGTTERLLQILRVVVYRGRREHADRQALVDHTAPGVTRLLCYREWFRRCLLYSPEELQTEAALAALALPELMEVEDQRQEATGQA